MLPRAETVWVCSQGVTVTPSWEALTHDTPVVVRAGLLLCLHVTVTARGVDWAARVCQAVRGVGDTHLLNDTVVAGLPVELRLAEVDGDVRPGHGDSHGHGHGHGDVRPGHPQQGHGQGQGHGAGHGLPSLL